MSITVLMSVYKSEKAAFLDQALRSVMEKQTLLPDQLVLIEDGELPEELHAVITKWHEALGDKMTILINEKNIGLTKSLNHGITSITTDLIARMDTDDISCPERFAKQVEYLNEHPEVDVLGGGIIEIDENEKVLNKRYYPANQQAVIKSIYRANPVAHSTVMIRKRIFDNGLRYNEKYRTNQDLALWIDAICAGYQIANLPDIILKFRRLSNVYYRRRRKKNLFNEFLIYCNGIRRIYGSFSLKYIYPVSRFILKLMPTCVVKWAYQSNIRRIVTEHEVSKVHA
mgnify:CR=1 FL=1